MEMTMNGQGSGGGRSTLCYSVVADPSEASSTGFQYFLEMFGARHSSGDLFDLVPRGGSSMEMQPTSFRLSSPPPLILPPSEDDMAAWLYPIVSGQEPALVAGHDDQPSSAVAGHTVVDDAPADHKRKRPPKMEEKSRGGAEDSTENYSCGSRKKATGGARRSHSHPAETHNLTEKRRRRKINDKLKTLRQLVPGCDDKSNQASTLDQTIQHIKSLQQQIQAMSFGCGGMMKPPADPVVPPRPGTSGIAAGQLPPAALAPAVLAMARGHVVRRPGVVLAPAPPPAAIAPFGPLLPLVHHAAPSCCCGTSWCTAVSNHADDPAGSGCSECIYSKNSRSQRQSL